MIDIAKVFVRENKASHMVGVHISVPRHPVIDRSYPPHNPGGTLLLQRVLQLSLAKEDVLVGDPWFCGFYNESTYIVMVKALAPAMAAIKAELAGLSLLPWAQAAWWCRHEEVWRTAHPVPEEGPFDRYTSADYISALSAEMKRFRAENFRATE